MNQFQYLVRNNRHLFVIAREVRDLGSLVTGTLRKSFSQHGEDKYLLKRFIGHQGFYVDIGASHPFRISNTYMLYKTGWEGVTVEPIPWLCKLNRRWRPRDKLIPKAVGMMPGKFTFYEMLPSVLSTLDADVADEYISTGRAEIQNELTIEVITINELLESYASDRVIDFLSIDIEGLDTKVVKGIDFQKFRPKVMSIEINDPSDDSSLLEFLSTVGYQLIDRYGCNMLVEEAM